jgi:integrase/recombinase XerD
MKWAQQDKNARPAEWAKRLSFVRGFARHWSAHDSRTEVPPSGLLPYRPARARPYLYSNDEIRKLLQAARRLPSAHGLRGPTYYSLLGLLAVAGLRISEVRNLQTEDVDLKRGVLTIRGTKFGKSRLVPIHPSTRKVLSDYASRRDRLLGRRPANFFVSGRGPRLDGAEIRRKFYSLSRQIGLRGPSDSHGPRLHDFRQNAESRKMPHEVRQPTGSSLNTGMPDDIFGSDDSALFPVLVGTSIAISGTRGAYRLVGNELAYRSVVLFWQALPPSARGVHASKFELSPRFRDLTRAQ